MTHLDGIGTFRDVCRLFSFSLPMTPECQRRPIANSASLGDLARTSWPSASVFNTVSNYTLIPTSGKFGVLFNTSDGTPCILFDKYGVLWVVRNEGIRGAWRWFSNFVLKCFLRFTFAKYGISRRRLDATRRFWTWLMVFRGSMLTFMAYCGWFEMNGVGFQLQIPMTLQCRPALNSVYFAGIAMKVAATPGVFFVISCPMESWSWSNYDHLQCDVWCLLDVFFGDITVSSWSWEVSMPSLVKIGLSVLGQPHKITMSSLNVWLG